MRAPRLVALVLAATALVAGPALADDGPTISAPSAATTSPAGAPLTPAAALPPLAPDGDLPLPVAFGRGRITVRAQRGLDGVARRLAVSADRDLAEIATDLQGLAVPPRVEIRLVADSADLGRAAPAGRAAPTWAAGVAFPDLGVVVVAMRRGGDPIDVDGTTAHELAHLALGAALGPAAPRWLHEGFATLHGDGDVPNRVMTLTGMTWFGSTIPLDQLDLSFPARELPAGRAYAESFDFVGFLVDRGRWDDRSDHGDRVPFRRFLRFVAGGDTLDRAAVRAYGADLRSLFDEWKADLQNRYLWFPIELFGVALWLFAALLVVLAWRRRRAQRRRTFDAWTREEESRAARRASPPPFVPWPGQPDPLAPDDDDSDLIIDDEPRGPPN